MAPRFQWPREQLARLRLTDAATVDRLLAEQRTWVHRRVETVTFLDELRVHFGVSVDFTLPRLGERDKYPRGLPIRYLPLTLLNKDVLKDFDLRDEANRVMPLLTRLQNAPIAELVLAIRASSLLGEPKVLDLYQRHRNLFSSVVGGRVGEDHGSDSDTARAHEALANFAASSPDSPCPLVRERGKMWEDAVLRSTLETLATKFLLLVAIDRPFDRRRRVFKFGYESRLNEPTGDRGDKALQGIALKSYAVRLETAGLYAAESFHIEIPTPDDVIVEAGQLVRSLKWADRPGQPPFQRQVISRQQAVDRAALYGVSPSGGYLGRLAEERKVEEAWAEISFALQPSLLWPVAGLITVTFAMFVFGLVARWGFGFHSVGDVSALVAVVPAILAAFVVPGGHRLVRRMYSGVRLLVGVCALLSFIAGGTLVIDLPFWLRAATWTVFAVVTGAAAGAMVRAAWRSHTVVRPPKTGIR